MKGGFGVLKKMEKKENENRRIVAAQISLGSGDFYSR